MKAFASLCAAIDQTTEITAKTAALAAYFRSAPEQDRLWTIALFSGRRPKRLVTATTLRDWAAEHAGLPLWLFEASQAIVGDLVETIALILPPAKAASDRSLAWWIERIRSLSAQDEAARKAGINEVWNELAGDERFLLAKLLTGGFRVGVSQTLMARALAQATGKPVADITHRLMGDWTPDKTTWERLIEAPAIDADQSRPYPFHLACQLDDPADLGDLSQWFAERKWDGIRGQLILRGGFHHLWSRGDDLITDRFPELAQLTDFLPQGTVLDGEVLAFADEGPLPFAALQKRIGRKSVPKKLLADAPVILMAYDLLEHQGQDIRDTPFAERRDRLEQLCAGLPARLPLRLSPAIPFATLDDLSRARLASRDLGAEGLMLKHLNSPYQTGRKRGDWWKWKVDPLTVDAVMIYARSGQGRRANLYTDFSFAVRDGDELVAFTKACSGLTDVEFDEITNWVGKHTLQRFGPVRQVTPELVFEIAFDGIEASPRHKSGIALRFPRIFRWRQDKPASEIGTLQDLKDLLKTHG